MLLLHESLTSLQYCGMWPSRRLEPGTWRYKAYSIYTILIVFLMHWFTLSELIYLLVTSDDITNFSDTCFMLLTTIAVCSKMIIRLMKRAEMQDVLTVLKSYPHRPLNDEEQEIQDNFDRLIRSLTLFYGVVTEITVWCMTVFTFFQNIPFGTLPYRAWLPYDYSGRVMYWFTFYQQLFSVVLAANLDIGFDTIIPGFILQICSQFNILMCRLRSIIDELDGQRFSSKEMNPEVLKVHERRIIECIKYHDAIFHIAKRVNALFTTIIFVQYSASSIIIGASILLISRMPLFSPKFIGILMYLSCMMFQIFMFCAAGDEARIQCENVINGIYTTKWYNLSNRVKKYVALMMVRTLRPVKFFSGRIIVLSLDSFCILIKFSYTAYTVLQRSSN